MTCIENNAPFNCKSRSPRYNCTPLLCFSKEKLQCVLKQVLDFTYPAINKYRDEFYMQGQRDEPQREPRARSFLHQEQIFASCRLLDSRGNSYAKAKTWAAARAECSSMPSSETNHSSTMYRTQMNSLTRKDKNLAWFHWPQSHISRNVQ